MKYLDVYLKKLKLTIAPTADIDFLTQLHNAHFYSIPFENFGMKENAVKKLSYDEIASNIMVNHRGGICFEFALLLEALFKHAGIVFRKRLARVLIPHTTPATHQFFIVTLNNQQWIFDIGFGAKGPRAPILLSEDYTHHHAFLSTRVNRHPVFGWVVSVKEMSKPDAVWEAIYAFHDTDALEPDIQMAHFYTLNHPESLLNTNKVASLPTPQGRISLRNNVFTEVKGVTSISEEITNKEKLAELLFSRFGLSIPSEQLS
ncbi:arylamine N-acetyltransferase [Enterobacter cloacae complex sp. ECC445]|uniref:arylamine N-acetyltransferase family protein n=1 Tax=Enterobacter cloacae complex sp. ECC445 TaxID=2913213 RepID=UPI001F2B1AC4|nr:arylamine N-acetyltransferase [Enterobacter cloacae complex sp. ECC445]MCG0456046.1 arylamine N-acetyltransferase [Enterobacter cloacae complex sp. ECC445]